MTGVQSRITEYSTNRKSTVNVAVTTETVDFHFPKGGRMKENTYITIQSWMRTELDLSGTELLVYAIIYGFSQDEESKYVGDRQYLADWCGCTTRSIQTVLNNLTERGLITKEEEYVGINKKCKYFTHEVKNFHSRSEKFSLNNINIKNKDINNSTTKVVELGTTRTSVLESSVTETASVKQPKKNRFQKCAEFIDTYTDNPILRDLLYRYFNNNPQLFANAFISKVKKLDTLVKDEDTKIAIVKQSVDNGWVNFYELKQNNNRYTNVMSENSSMKCERATEFSGNEEVY